MNLRPGQHQQNFEQNQQVIHHQEQQHQMNYQQQQQLNYQHQHQQISHQKKQEQMNYQLQPQQTHYQQQPMQLQPVQQQHLNDQMPQQQPLQLQQNQEEVNTLWVGGLQYWMDETYLYHCFSQTGHVCSVQQVRHKQTGYSEGYGYVEFVSQATAERVLQIYNGLLMPNTQCQPFRLQWASSATRTISFRPKASPEYSPFTSHLAPGGVTDHGVLQEPPKEGPENSPCEGDLAPGGVTNHGMLQETPKEGPEYSLWEGDLALGFITDNGVLQENPKESLKAIQHLVSQSGILQ